MKFGFRSSFVAVLLAGVVLGGVGSSAGVEAGRLSVSLGGARARDGTRWRALACAFGCDPKHAIFH